MYRLKYRRANDSTLLVYTYEAGTLPDGMQIAISYIKEGVLFISLEKL